MNSILIIDDDESVRSLIRIKFEAKYHIIEAENGKIGYAQFKKHRPDLVITDIIMPEEEGFKTILDLRKLDSQVPIIAITGMSHFGGLNSLEIAKEFGANVGLLKPVDLRQLQEHISTFLAT